MRTRISHTLIKNMLSFPLENPVLLEMRNCHAEADLEMDQLLCLFQGTVQLPGQVVRGFRELETNCSSITREGLSSNEGLNH